MWSVEQITEDIREIGVPPGASVLVHASLRSVGPIESGALGMVEALRAAVGDDGIVMAPTFTLQYCDPAEWASPPESEAAIERIRTQMPPFDPTTTPADQPRMGVLAEILRQQPGAVRSDHPAYSFTALGSNAHGLVAGAPFHYPLGSESPLARLHNLDGWVLLIGVGQDVNSSVHLAEVWANAPYIHRYLKVKSGADAWAVMQGTPGCSDGFIKLESVLRQARLLHKGYIGNAASCLIKQRELVSMAIAMLQGSPESLLCDRPSCRECSLARTFTSTRAAGEL